MGIGISSENIDHLGIVAGQCQALQIAQRIDRMMGKKHGSRIVSCGQAVVAMILNGLGFGNRRLYLTPQFFRNKPVEALIGPGITAEQLDDHCLGKALDEIAAYGSSRLFGQLAIEIGLEHRLLGTTIHLDSSSISVEGRYEKSEELLKCSSSGEALSEQEAQQLKITYGYSKDQRPDLKQLMVALCVTGESEFPIHYESQDGNSSDKRTFDPIIKDRIRTFKEQIKQAPSFRYVADSALYNQQGVLAGQDYTFISRVPETIKEARLLLEQEESVIAWRPYSGDKHYRLSAYTSEYGGIKQRYILVHSEKASLRESETFMRRLDKEEQALKKELVHVHAQVFGCKQDSAARMKDLEKKHPYYQFTHEVQAIEKHATPGRPKKEAEKVQVGWYVVVAFSRNQAAIARTLLKKGRFLLATNELDVGVLPDEQILSEYKQQQKVERGFRFLKDPYFMADGVFLKSERRIDALMMVMTLCLMVYNVAQFQMRRALQAANETIPNQIDRPISNPTLRWVFQLMEGVSIVTLVDEASGALIQRSVANITPLHQKIIRLFPSQVVFIYSG